MQLVVTDRHCGACTVLTLSVNATLGCKQKRVAVVRDGADWLRNTWLFQWIVAACIVLNTVTWRVLKSVA